MNYKDWLDEWLATCVKPMVKTRTFERYGDIVRLQIVPELGERDMGELSLPVLQRFAAELSERYSRNTVAGVINVIKNSLARAQASGLVKRQFSAAIKCPKAAEKQVESFTAAEQRKIENYVATSSKPKLFGIVLCLYTGLRVGELLALEWSDIDLTRGILTVTKTCRDSWQGGIYKKLTDSPKTSTSRRNIPVPRQLLPELRAIKKQSKSRYVISGKGGEEVSVRSYQRSFERMLKKLRIPHKGIHSLRHTFATRALECGIDVKNLSEILGHKNPEITLKRYAHSFMSHKTAMMNKLGRTYFSHCGANAVE